MKSVKEIADEIENVLSDPDKVFDADGDIVLAASKAEWELIIDKLRQ